jgi:hypothetical protein
VGDSVEINVVGNDSLCGTTIISYFSQPRYGILRLTDRNTFMYFYTGGVNPTSQYSFNDYFDYQIKCDGVTSNKSIVGIRITPNNRTDCEARFHPNDDYFEIEHGRSMFCNPRLLLRNDRACSGDLDSSSFRYNIYQGTRYGHFEADTTSGNPLDYIYVPDPRFRNVREIVEYTVNRRSNINDVKKARVIIDIE